MEGSVVSDDKWRWLAPPSGDDEWTCPFYLPWKKYLQEESKTMWKINGFSRKMISKWWVLHIYVRFPESTLDIMWFNLGEWWFGEYVSPFLSRNLFHNMCNMTSSPQADLTSNAGEIMGDHTMPRNVWCVLMCIDSHAFTLKRLILEFWSWSFNCSSL